MFDKIKKLKLYAEADDDLPEDMPVEEPDTEEPPPADTEEPTNELSNDFEDFSDEEFTPPDDYNANEYFDTQIADGTEDEDSSEYKRRQLALAKSYSAMFDKYKDVILNLKNIDATGDRAVVITAIVRKYEELMEALIAYSRDCSDSFEVKYKTFIEFRAAFITINDEVESINTDVQLIQ